MKVIEYLNALGQEYLRRSSQELGLQCRLLFGEDDQQQAWAEIIDENGNGVVLRMGFPLMAEDEFHYVPKVSDAEWGLFVREVKPWRFKDESPSSV